MNSFGIYVRLGKVRGSGTLNMKTTTKSNNNQRRGSTLVIVIALLGLLAFVGMVFFSFASSERSSAEYFSEAAKGDRRTR